MKTALQQLVDYINGFDEAEITSDMMYILEEAERLIPVDRQQIEDAYLKGAEFIESIEINPASWKADMNKSNYFNQTYTK